MTLIATITIEVPDEVENVENKVREQILTNLPEELFQITDLHIEEPCKQ
jgi:hypothetical protein